LGRSSTPAANTVLVGKIWSIAIRMLFDHLVTGGARAEYDNRSSRLAAQPCALREGAAPEAWQGQAPVLTADEAGELLRSIETESVLGLRDRAVIGVMVMVFTFACQRRLCSRQNPPVQTSTFSKERSAG
jgi:hypothetical protein